MRTAARRMHKHIDSPEGRVVTAEKSDSGRAVDGFAVAHRLHAGAMTGTVRVSPWKELQAVHHRQRKQAGATRGGGSSTVSAPFVIVNGSRNWCRLIITVVMGGEHSFPDTMRHDRGLRQHGKHRDRVARQHEADDETFEHINVTAVNKPWFRISFDPDQF